MLWKNPRNSAIALAAATGAWAFLQFGNINPIQTSAYLLLTAVLGCFLWNNLASFTHRCAGKGGGVRGRRYLCCSPAYHHSHTVHLPAGHPCRCRGC